MTDPGSNTPLRGGAQAVEIAREVVAILEGERGAAGAVATVVGRAGSAPQSRGAKLVLREDGTLIGTVGGGAIEAQVIDACRQTLRDGKNRTVESHLVRDLGMCCGGAMEVFVEYLQPLPRLVILGAGHVAQALVPMASAAGFRPHVYDDRDDLLDSPVFEGMVTGNYDVDELDAALPNLSDRDYVVIMTRDHARDEKALAYLLRQPHHYIGMIGSRRKVHTVLGRILHRETQLGRPAPDLSRLRAPIGLALGGRTPGEIAVSIMAELVADRHAGSGDPMSVVDDAEAKAPAPAPAKKHGS